MILVPKMNIVYIYNFFYIKENKAGFTNNYTTD